MSKREEVTYAIIRKLKNIYLTSIGWESYEENCNRRIRNLTDQREKQLQDDVLEATTNVDKAIKAQLKTTKCGGVKYELYRESINVSFQTNDAVKEAIKDQAVAVKTRDAYWGKIQDTLNDIGNLRTQIEDELVLGGKYDTIIASLAKKFSLATE